MSQVSIDNIENAIKKLTADILEAQERTAPYTMKKNKSLEISASTISCIRTRNAIKRK